MKTKFLTALMIIIIGSSLVGYSFFSQNQHQNEQQFSDEITKLDIKSLFNVYGFGKNFEIKNGKKVWNDVKFELNPENDKIYEELNYYSKENVVVILPTFTAIAYNEPGFYTYFRGECDEKCLTIKIQKEYHSDHN